MSRAVSGKVAPRAVTGYRNPGRVDTGQLPGQQCAGDGEGVLSRGRERMLGCEPVVHADHDNVAEDGDVPGGGVGHVRTAEHPSTAMEVRHHRQHVTDPRSVQPCRIGPPLPGSVRSSTDCTAVGVPVNGSAWTRSARFCSALCVSNGGAPATMSKNACA